MIPDVGVLSLLPDDLELHFTVSVGQLREWMQSQTSQVIQPVQDLGVEEVAAAVRRAPSTVRGWFRDGYFEGGYKLNGRDWFCSREALAVFLQRASMGENARKRRITPPGRASRSRKKRVDMGGWREELREKPPHPRKRQG